MTLNIDIDAVTLSLSLLESQFIESEADRDYLNDVYIMDRFTYPNTQTSILTVSHSENVLQRKCRVGHNNKCISYI